MPHHIALGPGAGQGLGVGEGGRLHLEDIPRKGGACLPGPYLPLHTDHPPPAEPRWVPGLDQHGTHWSDTSFTPLTWERGPLEHRHAQALAFQLWLRSRRTCLLSKFCRDPLAIRL